MNILRLLTSWLVGSCHTIAWVHIMLAARDRGCLSMITARHSCILLCCLALVGNVMILARLNTILRQICLSLMLMVRVLTRLLHRRNLVSLMSKGLLLCRMYLSVMLLVGKWT